MRGVADLPGGPRLTFHGKPPFFKDKICRKCGIEKAAAFFYSGWKWRRGRCRVLIFGQVCMRCVPAGKLKQLPKDPRPFCVDKLTDNEGKEQVWYQRNRRGLFGRPLPAREAQFLFDPKTGLFRCQPKLVRLSVEQLKKRAYAPRVLAEERFSHLASERNIPWEMTLKAARLQDNECLGCERQFSDEVELTGDHDIPYSRGGSSTDQTNVIALCRSCNSSKGDRTFKEWQRDKLEKEQDRERVLRDFPALPFTE